MNILKITLSVLIIVAGSRAFALTMPDLLQNDQLDAVITKAGNHYVSADIDNDGKDELAIMLLGQDTNNPDHLYVDFAAGVYESTDGKIWKLSSSVDKEKMNYLKPAADFGKRVSVLGLKDFCSEKNLLNIVTLTAGGEKAVILPVFFNALYGVKILGYNGTELSQLAEIQGVECIKDYDNDGAVEFLGKEIQTDLALLSAENRKYFIYEFRDGKITRSDTLPGSLYDELLKKKNDLFLINKDITSFTDAFLFQIAEGKKTEAKKWFKANSGKLEGNKSDTGKRNNEILAELNKKFIK